MNEFVSFNNQPTCKKDEEKYVNISYLIMEKISKNKSERNRGTYLLFDGHIFLAVLDDSEQSMEFMLMDECAENDYPINGKMKINLISDDNWESINTTNSNLVYDGYYDLISDLQLRKLINFKLRNECEQSILLNDLSQYRDKGKDKFKINSHYFSNS